MVKVVQLLPTPLQQLLIKPVKATLMDRHGKWVIDAWHCRQPVDSELCEHSRKWID